ncbi:MAG: DUF1501 domain-containing protein [Pirellulaceae bacterium]
MHPSTPLLKRCSGPLDRRTWLRIGGLNFGALAVGLQPSLAGVLTAAEQQAQVDKDFSVILFWANGGPSHIDLFDLKPAAPVEYRGPFKPIRTAVPGIEITELLPRLAGIADKFTLIRSLHHERNEHSGGTHRFLSGYPSKAANLNHGEYPELGSVVARSLDDRAGAAARQREIPLLVANTAFYGGGPAYLGPAYTPYMPAPNPITASGENEYDPVPIYNSGGGQDDLAISSAGILSLTRRMQLLQNLDAFPRQLDRSGTMAALDRFQQHAVGMLSSPRAREAFDLSRESERTRDRYGRTHFGKSLLTCRRLIEAGVRFVQCQAEFRLRPETGVTSNWDDHSVNSHIFKSFEEKLPSFDESVSALIEDLSLRGLDRQVLFIFCGEFGRTPKIMYNSPEKRPGRDHWNKAMSVLLAGGGLKMGQVIGQTSAKAEEPVKRVMDSNCLLATIYRRFGIDTSRTYSDNSGRPIAILPSGAPIRELF